MKMRNLLFAVAVMLLTQSCATMFSGTRYTAHISATKPGSEIYVNGKLEGTDDASVRLHRKIEPKIEVKNSGTTTEFVLYRTIKWGSQVANLLNWIYIIPTGTIIDAATGAIWQPEHKKIEEVTKIDEKNFNVRIDNGRD